MKTAIRPLLGFFAGHTELVKMLLDKGADVNVTNKDGVSALSAVFEGRPAGSEPAAGQGSQC